MYIGMKENETGKGSSSCPTSKIVGMGSPKKDVPAQKPTSLVYSISLCLPNLINVLKLSNNLPVTNYLCQIFCMDDLGCLFHGRPA